jgi:hypothetical protein
MLAMTLPTAGPWASSIAMPQTQNTAPVLEFRCLYTLDLRRKQKRWQDGRLKFHTFNKRIMVYDDRSNFVGDSHWREDHAFAEGEEVELERCGILVEVSEFVGTREQDLTPLLNRVVKDRQEKSHVRAVASSLLRPPGLDIRTQTIGLPHAEATDLRSAKRRKPNNSPSSKNGYAQDLTGAILALSGTPSTAGPLRYDPLWLRTMKQPIEGIDMSDGSGIHRMPQERPVPISKSQTKMSGSQAKRMSKKLSPACVNSGYARNITGAALVLASKTLRSRGLPPASGIVRKAVTRLDENGPAAITIEEDEFVDIDVYDKENLRVEKALGSSSQVTDLAKTRQEKPLPDSLSHQPQFEGDRHERPFNPLRIRTRPKRKLLLSATPPSRPLSLTGPSVETGNGAIFSPKSPKYDRESLLSLATVPQHAPVTEIVSFDIKGHCSSSPVNAGMDHHGIDVLLTRKVSGQTSMAEGQYGNVQARTEYRNSIRSAEESKELTGLEGQDRALLSHILGPQLEIKQKVTRSPRQPLILRGNTDTEIDRDRVSIHISFFV